MFMHLLSNDLEKKSFSIAPIPFKFKPWSAKNSHMPPATCQELVSPHNWSSLMAELDYTAAPVMPTTASLSHLARTELPLQSSPHSAASMTTGARSLMVIWLLAMGPAHCSMNQWLPANAPHPQFPDTSDITVIVL